ncbi:MAG TPA: hypothetical protein VEI02_01625 [Planctomycetota bacterium]|nr:hypothetical protein [Planctomycetota bacterium]
MLLRRAEAPAIADAAPGADLPEEGEDRPAPVYRYGAAHTAPPPGYVASESFDSGQAAADARAHMTVKRPKRPRPVRGGTVLRRTFPGGSGGYVGAGRVDLGGGAGGGTGGFGYGGASGVGY